MSLEVVLLGEYITGTWGRGGSFCKGNSSLGVVGFREVVGLVVFYEFKLDKWPQLFMIFLCR